MHEYQTNANVGGISVMSRSQACTLQSHAFSISNFSIPSSEDPKLQRVRRLSASIDYHAFEISSSRTLRVYI